MKFICSRILSTITNSIVLFRFPVAILHFLVVIIRFTEQVKSLYPFLLPKN